MNAVLYYSNAGECKRIAEYIASKTGYGLYDITAGVSPVYESAAIVFPVYCQNIPKTVKRFLSQLQAERIIVIAAYGKMSYGNVLQEIRRRYRHNIVGAAYTPVKHAYLDEPQFSDFEKLDPVIEKLQSPTAVQIPRCRKNIFANFAPELRSRMGVKIIRNGVCDGCGICERICPRGAIKNGKTNRKCIRCTKCAVNCPNNVLSVRTGALMRRYLRKRRKTDLIVYI